MLGSSTGSATKAKGPRSSTTISIRQIDNLQTNSQKTISNHISNGKVISANSLSQKTLPQPPSSSSRKKTTTTGSSAQKQKPHSLHKQPPHYAKGSSSSTSASYAPSASSSASMPPPVTSTAYTIKPATSMASSSLSQTHHHKPLLVSGALSAPAAPYMSSKHKITRKHVDATPVTNILQPQVSTTHSHAHAGVARKRTLNVPGRQPSGKNIPLLRAVDSPPPNARAGKTVDRRE